MRSASDRPTRTGNSIIDAKMHYVCCNKMIVDERERMKERKHTRRTRFPSTVVNMVLGICIGGDRNVALGCGLEIYHFYIANIFDVLCSIIFISPELLENRIASTGHCMSSEE
jgi:hypothetical protein